MLCLLPAMLWAQQREGKVIYRQTTQVKVDESRMEQMTEEQRNRMKERMKRMGKAKKTLVFRSTESLYRNYEAKLDSKDESAWEEAGGDGRQRWRSMRPKSLLYQSLVDQVVVEQQEFFDKKFLIEGDQPLGAWKFTGRQEKVLNYTCMEAVCVKNDSITIRAWFTSEVPVSAGPAGIGGLPGLILKVDIDDGQTVLVAEEVLLEAVAEGDIEKPTKGKAVSREDFEQIVREKRAEMREMRGEGGGRGPGGPPR